MKKVRIPPNRRGKTDPRRDAANADAPAVPAADGASNGRIDIPRSLSGFRQTVFGSSGQFAASAVVLDQLYRALGQVTTVSHPRTFKLLQSGDRKLARKVIEEACEVTVEAVKRHADGVVGESADLLYHLVVLWRRIGIEPIEVWQEMQTRADTLGIAEKLPKRFGPKTAPVNSNS